MPRNDDGTFTRVINWTEEQLNKASFSGKKLDYDLDGLAAGIQDSLDTYGRNKVQANIDVNGFRFVNAGDAINDSDYVTLGQLNDAIAPLESLVGDTENGVIRLSSNKSSLIIEEGFTFSFRPTFTFNITPEKLRSLNRYERFEIKVGDTIYSGDVVRGPIDPNSSSPDDHYDLRPSFINNEEIYKIETIIVNDSLFFRVKDDNLEGQVVWRVKSTEICLPGYIDLSINYGKEISPIGVVAPISTPLAGFDTLVKGRAFSFN